MSHAMQIRQAGAPEILNWTAVDVGGPTAATHLRDRGAALVGIDSLNIDDTNSPTRPVHSILLAAGIPIVEHLTNLSALPIDGFAFSAAPPKIVAMGTFPVRAHAIL